MTGLTAVSLDAVRKRCCADRSYEVGKTGDGLVTTGTPFLAHGGVRARL